MNYYLLLKEHNKTKLKYLCKFTEGIKIKSPFIYKGSGKYWKRHIKKHGNDVNTKILYLGNCEKELSACAIFWSSFYDVANNKEFANIIPENGLDGGGLYMKGKHLSKEHKEKISKFFKGRKHTKETKQLISKLAIGRKRPDLILLNKKKIWTKEMRNKLAVYAASRTGIKKKPHSYETKIKISNAIKQWHKNNV
jgi:hypothetical protein